MSIAGISEARLAEMEPLVRESRELIEMAEKDDRVRAVATRSREGVDTFRRWRFLVELYEEVQRLRHHLAGEEGVCARAVAAEREACAKIAEAHDGRYTIDGLSVCDDCMAAIADAIRARRKA
jgi:hypothetical protein